jgi:hypothetical protein
MYPLPPRDPNIACAAQPVVEVGKEKRSGEMRPSLMLMFVWETELIGSRASILSGFILSRSQVSTLEAVESRRFVALYLEASAPPLLPSRARVSVAE